MRGKKTVLAVAMVAVIIYASLSVGNVGASSTPGLVVEPHFVSGEIGDIFTVDVLIENLEPVGIPPIGCYAWQIHMNWSTSVLNFSSHVWEYYGKTVTTPHYWIGDFMADAPHGSNDFKFFDYDAGYCEISESMVGSEPEDRDGTVGSGLLFTAEFEVIGSGETEIDISTAYYTDPALTTILNYYAEKLEVEPVNARFLSVPSPWPTDINIDGRIDIRDIARVSIKWGWEGTPGAIPEDVNTDGVVDILDLSAVGLEYGSQYYP
ncbi:MAG: hypothetical protein JSV64_06720 [Candidatus Bathyarchaeota archaeon]|nr:MAG: hypothetical protein JSV64_06720 [Candidatus Bathyarchaeota archaeon]